MEALIIVMSITRAMLVVGPTIENGQPHPIDWLDLSRYLLWPLSGLGYIYCAPHDNLLDTVDASATNIGDCRGTRLKG
jgi:hypothetical protein